MRSLVGVLVVLLIGSLAALFSAFAIAIRRDFTERFERISARLQEDAQAVLRHFIDRPITSAIEGGAVVRSAAGAGAPIASCLEPDPPRGLRDSGSAPAAQAALEVHQ